MANTAEVRSWQQERAGYRLVEALKDREK